MLSPLLPFLWLGTLLPAGAGAARVRVVGSSREYPLGSEIENLMVRPCGSVLTVVDSRPEIYEVAAADGAAPRLIHRFSGATGVSGIAGSRRPDEYFVAAGNFSFAEFAPTPRSYAIYRLTFDGADRRRPVVVVRRLASLDAVAQPNGMTHVPGSPYVLIADCRAGLIFRFDTDARRLDLYFDHPLLKPKPADGIYTGVNGLKFAGGYLYFSNSNLAIVARIRADGREDPASLEGRQPEIVATDTPADDFILDGRNGDLWIAADAAGALQYLPGDPKKATNGTVPQTVLGGGNSTELQTITAAAWAKGQEGRTLLLTVSGPFQQFATGNYTGGGRLKIVRVS